jgi:hypothetical protein
VCVQEKMQLIGVVAVLAVGAAVVSATPLDDYLNKPEPDYQWHDTLRSFK